MRPRSLSLLPILLLASALFMAGCATQAQDAPSVPSTPVRTVLTQASAAANAIRAVGIVEPASTVELSFPVGGPVSRILVDVGDRVEPGQVLAELHMEAIDAQVQQAQAAWTKAERDAMRMRRLHADSVVTLAQLQDAETGLEVAGATLEQARFNQSWATIRAQSSGRVLERTAEPGQTVGPGRTILRVGETSGWMVAAQVTDTDALRLRIGDEARMTLDAWPDRSWNGRITEMAETADPRSGLFRVEIRLDDAPAGLRSGFVARVALSPAGSLTGILIPAEALIQANGRDGSVFVADTATGTAHLRQVRIGQILDAGVLISSGLEAGERLVTDGAAYLQDGSPIETID